MANPGSKFVWYELMTSDIDGAERFYRDVVGWGVRDSGMPGMVYHLLTAGDDQVAGLFTLPDEAAKAGARPGWLGYVGVADVDVSAKQAVAAGAKIIRDPADIPGIGRFVILADPQGAAFALFAGMGDSPADMMKQGHIGWHELYAKDGPSAFDFYAALLGWEKESAMDMGPMGIYQMFKAGAGAIGGMMTMPPTVPMPAWLFYINVAAIDAAAARVTAGGGAILNGPMAVPGGMWIIQCSDPQGAMFALVAPGR